MSENPRSPGSPSTVRANTRRGWHPSPGLSRYGPSHDIATWSAHLPLQLYWRSSKLDFFSFSIPYHKREGDTGTQRHAGANQVPRRHTHTAGMQVRRKEDELTCLSPQRVPMASLLVVVGAALSASQSVDHGMKLQQIVGSASAVRVLVRSPSLPPRPALNVCLLGPQAAKEAKYDVALAKLTQLQGAIDDWRNAITSAKARAEAPATPEVAPEPPAESIEYSMNVRALTVTSTTALLQQPHSRKGT